MKKKYSRILRFLILFIIFVTGYYFFSTQNLEIKPTLNNIEFQSYIKEINVKNEIYYNNEKYLRIRSFLDVASYKEIEEDEALKNSKSWKKFDKRLLPAIWLYLINSNLNLTSTDVPNPSILPKDFVLPFNWDLLMNISPTLFNSKYFEPIVLNKGTCGAFKDLSPKNQPSNFIGDYCKDIVYPSSDNDYGLSIRVLKKIDQPLSDIDWRHFHARIYNLLDFPAPQNVLFLGALNRKKNKGLLVPLQKISNGENNLADLQNPLKTIYQQFSDVFIQDRVQKYGLSKKDVLLNGISVYHELTQLNEQLSNIDLEKYRTKQLPIYKTKQPMVIGEQIKLKAGDPIDINQDLFSWYLPKVLKNLQNEIKLASDEDDITQITFLKNHAEKLLSDKYYDEIKYFGNAAIEGQKTDDYDWRFFDANIYKENNKSLRLSTLHKLARVWFRLCQQFDVPTWLNNDALVGWYWNGLTLPYENKLEFQIPIQSLHNLAKILNNTLIYDFTNEPFFEDKEFHLDNKAELGISSYYLDINPMYFERNSLKNNENLIDAKLIDTTTGMFIEIMALTKFQSETLNELEIEKKILLQDPAASFRIMSSIYLDNFFNEDGEFFIDIDQCDSMRDLIISKIEKFQSKYSRNKESYEMEKSPTFNLFGEFIYSKNYYTYNIKELSHLIPTFFENSIAYLPSNWYRNLLIEHGPTLDPITDKGAFFEKFKMWIPFSDCPDLRNNNDVFKDTIELSARCKETADDVNKEHEKIYDYAIQHGFFRDMIEPKDLHQNGVLKYDFKKLKPILDQFTGTILRASPWVEENLF